MVVEFAGNKKIKMISFSNKNNAAANNICKQSLCVSCTLCWWQTCKLLIQESSKTKIVDEQDAIESHSHSMLTIIIIMIINRFVSYIRMKYNSYNM